MKAPKFTITPDQWRKYKKWEREQEEKSKAICEKKKTRGFIVGSCAGGAYTWKFTPTGLGTAVTVENAITSDSVDLTDYENW